MNKYLDKVAGMAGVIAGAPKMLGRTINAAKGADGVFKASTPLKDTMGFLRANKKPLAIGAGVGALGAAGITAGMQGQEKQANLKGTGMNKYLEKIAATYNVRPHTVDESLGAKSVGMNKQEFEKYQHDQQKAMPGKRIGKYVGVGAGVGAAYGGTVAHLLSKGKLGRAGAAVGGVLGAGLGLNAVGNVAHNEALEGMGAYGSKKMLEGYQHKKAEDILSKIASEKWIQGAIKHPGALHKALGVPADEKIPEAKLEAAAKKGGKIGREARLAETLKNFHHGKK